MTNPNTSSNDNPDKATKSGCQSVVSEKGKEKKVKFSHKLVVFTGSVIALSWVFEGVRKVQESFTLEHVLILLAGTVLTIFFVGIHSYWIYLEEKLKGTLKKRIGLFEKIYEYFSSKEDHCSNAMAVSKGE